MKHLIKRHSAIKGTAFAILTIILTSLSNALECSSTGEACQRSSIELWVANSRSASRCTSLDAGFERVTYDRWDACSRVFIRESLETFLAAQQDIPTLLYAHGNSLTHPEAMESCWRVRDRLSACQGHKMLVYWSWPSEIVYTHPLIVPMQLIRKNVKTKYVYAEYQGYYIAKLTQLMSKQRPLTLGGHSFGGLAVISALHFLGGGELNGLVLAGGSPVQQPNLRAAVVSAALDNDAMYPGRRHSQAFAPVETFFASYNDRDSTLKRWPVHSFRGQEAAGYTGLCAARLGPYSHKLIQQKLTEDVGTAHDIKSFMASDRMISALCRTAFKDASQEASSPSDIVLSQTATSRQRAVLPE